MMKLFKKTKVENEDEEVVQEEVEENPIITPKKGPKRGMSVIDFVLRIVAAIGTLGSAIAMRNTNGSSLLVFKEFFHFSPKYDDLPTITFFVVANSIVCAYLAVSLILSIFHIIKKGARISRAILIILDTLMLAFLMSGASAAAAIVHLAHRGNSRVNWGSICHQYNSFCERVSGSLVGSFIAILLLLFLIILSALSLSKS